MTVTVPVLALLQDAGEGIPDAVEGLPHSSRRAEPEGCGPVPVGPAERIAARAPSWARIRTHPVTGTALDRDRSTYAVPADPPPFWHPGSRRRAGREPGAAAVARPDPIRGRIRPERS